MASGLMRAGEESPYLATLLWLGLFYVKILTQEPKGKELEVYPKCNEKPLKLHQTLFLTT